MCIWADPAAVLIYCRLMAQRGMTSVLVCVVASAGCGIDWPEPQTRPIEEALGTAVPIGYAASIAIAALSGHNPPCVTFETPCSDPPCDGGITIDVGEACPLPLLVNARGSAVVTGTWANEDTLFLAAVFGDVSVGERKLVVDRADAFVASREGESWTIAYADEDIAVNSSREVELQQSGWTLELDPGATPDDPFDDVITVSGAMQAVENLRVTQTGLAMVRIEATCVHNPLNGLGTFEILAADVSDIELTTMYFEDHCDGRVRVVVSLGTGIASSGQLIELDLLASEE